MTITNASVVGDKPFIMQRAPVSDGAVDFEDAFLSVASVNDLADLAVDDPAEGSVFYRTGTVDLFFPHLTELKEAVESIEASLRALAAANDIAVALADESFSCFPADSCDRYWGLSSLTSLTNDQLLGLNSEPAFALETTKTFDTEGQSLYIYFAHRASLGDASFVIDGEAASFLSEARDVTKASGSVDSYLVYRLTSLINGANLELSVTAA